MYSSGLICLLLLYVVDCTSDSQLRTAVVVLLNTVHCHTAGQMNDCTKNMQIQPPTYSTQNSAPSQHQKFQCKDRASSAPSPPVRMEWEVMGVLIRINSPSTRRMSKCVEHHSCSSIARPNFRSPNMLGNGIFVATTG